MPRIVGRSEDGAVLVGAGGVAVVVAPDQVRDGGCRVVPAELVVRLVGEVDGFAAVDEPVPPGLLSADQLAAMLAWEAAYVDGGPDRPGLSPSETDLYLRFRPDTGDPYAGRAVASAGGFALAVSGTGHEIPSATVEIVDQAPLAADSAPEPEPALVVQLCASMVYLSDLTGQEIVADAATDLIDRISYVATVDEFYPELARVVAAGVVPPLAVDLAGGFGPETILDFLTRLVAELDRRRPWPEPAFIPVDPATWPSIGTSVPIGWLDVAIEDLEWAVKAGFADVPPGENPLLVLRMRDERLFALVGDPDPHPTRFLVLLPEGGDQASPAAVGEYLRRYAGVSMTTDGLAEAMTEVRST
ncbi:hypothetical protein [Nocardia sp. NPDC003979]